MFRIAKVSSAFPGYFNDLYERHPEWVGKPHAEQRRLVMHDAFGWFDAWETALNRRGYAAVDLLHGATELQLQWGRENGIPAGDACNPDDLLIAELRSHRPEILWYDLADTALLPRIRREVPSIRKILGWVGSAMPGGIDWGQFDLTLSCAPESVERIVSTGASAAHLHHAFDPRVLGRIGATKSEPGLAFVGSIERKRDFHLERERLLAGLAGRIPIRLYSPAAIPVSGRGWRGMTRRQMVRLLEILEKGLGSWWIPRFLDDRLGRTVSGRLRPHLRPPCYGLAMYRALRSHAVTLNIHADSSPRFAGNMRLFETTGIGACLLTDHRQNLAELFESDTEVAVYRSGGECIEKAEWLLAHPSEAHAMASRAQRRCLAQHTFDHRVDVLKKYLNHMMEKS